ncbi:DNA alkylation repair enzyme [Tritonibacter multivorans]|uniref:DNA alkylation repair enzyme n=1 Tax=Tritonibacter multivorans TaxID=928856 RepID=A0A0N7M0H1_9RHOB|nr:DNA alkylation repair enzyme [Tritonibacter multivorans]SFC80506.1 3-methyladenine DNA glycosylase AlkC [Tritonibacter multivorans]
MARTAQVDQGYSLKDELFNATKIEGLAALFAPHAPGFSAAGFTGDVMSRMLDLELKARISWIADCLQRHVPGDLHTIAPVLRAALPPPLDPTLTDDDFGDFIYAPLGEWVTDLVTEDSRDLGLDLLEEITQRFSMEWALRPFLLNWPEETLARVADWCAHDNYHIRRLASEGTRPRLPWGQAVGLPFDATLPVLARLYGDRTRYVTRSVANHLNDIAKKDAELVVDTLTAWQAQGQQAEKEMAWITAHALRGLVKAGHPGALALLGYDPDMDVDVRLSCPASAVIGEKLAFSCDIQGATGAGVLVDYRITFCRPGGKSSVKVYKLKQAKIGTSGLTLSKAHGLKANASTFTLVPGAHLLEVMVNGRVRAQATFDLVEDAD